jgi:hypothetical protein
MMDRRTLIQTLLGLSASATLPFELAAQEETPKLSLTSADAVSDASRRLLTAEELSTLRHLGKILMPASGTMPGAVEAEAAEFLDFLLSQSTAAAQLLYRSGIRKLNQDAQTRTRKPFAQLTDVEAAPLLAPLQTPWTYAGPSDPYGKFLQAAKLAFWQATMNSRQWAVASAGGTRGGAGVGAYWLPIE